MDKTKVIESFFESDLKIKNVLLELAPSEEDILNPENYSDKLYNSLDTLEYHLEKMLIVLHPFEIDYASKLIKSYKIELEKIGADYGKLKAFYQACFSNMSEKLIDYTNSNCIGYTSNFIELNKASTINELVHLLHSELINSGFFYKSFPSLEEKQNFEGYTISLRGNQNDMAKSIYDNLQTQISLGPTDIISFNDKSVYMMIRDRGHALTIEVEKNNDRYKVNYFIPKICNAMMVNRLKGVTKVDNNSKYTKGVFETDNLSEDIISLIEGVPMDDDMFKEGGLFFSDEIEKKGR